MRLRVLLENECTVLCCTPTYALHLPEVSRAEGLDSPPRNCLSWSRENPAAVSRGPRPPRILERAPKSSITTE